MQRGCIISQRKTGWDGDEVLGFVCVNQRDLRETFGILPCGLIEYFCVLFSRGLRRSRRGMQQDCIISQRKTGWDGGEVNAVLLFVCVNQRDQWETLGLLCADCLSTFACYSPADPADHAEECSKLHYFAEKDRLVRLRWFCCLSA